MCKLALLPSGAFYDEVDSNPDSDSNQLDSDLDSRKKGRIRIQLDSDSSCLDSDPDSDSRCPDSHITDTITQFIFVNLNFCEFTIFPILPTCKVSNRTQTQVLKIRLLSVLQTRESLSVVLRATYPENQVALTESK